MHLLALMLKGGNTGSSLLTVTICGLTLHSWLFIEIQLNEFMLMKIDKIVNRAKKNVFNKSKHFITLCLFFSSNNCEYPLYHQH